ncbi:MAG: right-handed parallel beta-helix repeat-containing protein, partial [Planctomycetota bacterium]
YGPTDGWTLGYYTLPDTTTWEPEEFADNEAHGGYNPAADADYGGVVPEGENTAYTSSFAGYDTGLSQILSATLQANTQYDLSVLVGNPVLYNEGLTADYRIELLAGGVLLASDTGPSPVDDTTWTTASLSYNSGADPVQLGQPLEIRLLAVDFSDWYEVHFDNVTLSYDVGVTIPVDPNSDLAAANASAMPGDTIEFAAGIYNITSQLEIKSDVTYLGAGAGLTIIDGNNVTRAFTAWGDRSANNGQVDANGVGVPNLTGPTGWVLDGLTMQNCVSDDVNRQDILSSARDLLNNYPGAPYTLATAQEENGGITDNPEWFDVLSGGADDDLTDAELQAYLDANPVGSEGHLIVNDDKRDDGGAVCILNGAAGTIRNCAFADNAADDDGGAVMVDGTGLDVAIDNCTFDLNTCGDEGGAVKLSGNASTHTLANTIITGCSAGDDGGGVRADGDDASYVLTDCTIAGCYASDDGGAVRYGPDRSELTVTNCAFIGNGMDADGEVVTDDSGAWSTNDDDAGSMTFMNCLFADNACVDNRVVEVRAAFSFLNCTFVGNVVGDEALLAIRGRAWDSTGDGVDDVTTDDSIIDNCLFINNTLLSNTEVIGDTRDDVFAPTVTNCLFFGNLDQNDGPAVNADGNSTEVGTIDVSAVTDAAQIVVDPAGDYHLVAGSPAIDASNPATATEADIEGTPAVGVRDVGAYEFVGP